MKIEDFIRNEIFKKRLRERRLLVVYEGTASKRYRSLAEKAAKDEKGVFYDVSEGSLPARLGAGEALTSGLKQPVVIYVPKAAPASDFERRNDPFFAFALIGRYFPDSAKDQLLQICINKVPKKEAAIRALFAKSPEEGPAFAAIDALLAGADAKWPQLKAASGKSSEAEILKWLLISAEEVDFEDVRQEATEFAENVAGAVVKASQSFAEFRDALWCACLATELFAVYGEGTPSELSSVARADSVHEKEVADAVASLRDLRDTSIYRKEAKAAEQVLHIGQAVKKMALERSALTFEAEAVALRGQILAALLKRDCEKAKALNERFGESLWSAEEAASLINDLFSRTVRFFDAQKKLAEDLKHKLVNVRECIDAYCRIGAEADGEARKFAELWDDALFKRDEIEAALPEGAYDQLQQLAGNVFNAYRDLAEKEQQRFLAAVDKDGWPASGMLANGDVFDRVIAPALQQEGEGVAWLLIDGLRYEIGATFKELLLQQQPKLAPACAPLPSITSVGKGALLPGGSELSIEVKNNDMVPELGSVALKALDDRLKVLSERYGERFRSMTPAEVLSARKAAFDKTDLLLIRDDDLDAELESDKMDALKAVRRCAERVKSLVKRLSTLGRFGLLVVTSDHGFVLNLKPMPGDKCPMPVGNWTATHDRFLLGEGNADVGTAVYPAAFLGIRTNVPQAAFPTALCAYKDGKRYFHGGLSLPEAIVPVITARLEQQKANQTSDRSVTFTRRKDLYTSRIVRLELTLNDSLFSADDDREVPVRIEIFRKGDRSRKAAGFVAGNDAGIVGLTAGLGHTIKVQLDDFDGRQTFTVRALDAESGVSLGETSFEAEVMG
ncbi:MAG: hypothetical protein ACFWTZ_07230 [Burkholderia sp.]|jgi:hypothetical protein